MNRVISLLFMVSLLWFANACSNTAEQEGGMDSKYQQILELVTVGMDIDQAVIILKENGFTVGKKVYPTEKKNYSQVLIPLSKTVPFSATIAETIGKGTGRNIYVIIQADEKGKIFKIQH